MRLVLSSAARAETSRIVGIDAARAFATLGIVLVHVCEFQGLGHQASAVGRFGTAYYIFVAIYLCAIEANRAEPRGFFDDAERRARRVLRPFVVWSIIYAALALVHAFRRGSVTTDIARWWGPLAGTALHLWFLPFAFAVTLIVRPLLRPLMVLPLRYVVASWAAVVCFAYPFSFLWAIPGLDRRWLLDWHLHRFDRWLEEVPFVLACVGVVVLWFRRDQWLPRGVSKRLCRFSPWLLALAFLGTEWRYVLSVETLRASGLGEGRPLAHLAGLVLALLALRLPRSRRLAVPAVLGRHTYFVFLCHVALLDLAGGFWWRLPGYGSLLFAWLSGVAVFAVGVSAGALLSRAPAVARWFS